MTAAVWFIVKASLCSGLLICYYWFFLRNRGFHSFNRFYLLSTVIASLCIPLIKIECWQQLPDSGTNVIQLLQAVNGTGEHADEPIPAAENNTWSMLQWALMTYVSVSSVLLFAFARSLYTIKKLAAKKPVKKLAGISLINTSEKNAPFSFLHFIFWNSRIDIDSANGKQILEHEIAHVKGRHSYDKIFINLVLVVCWCNPFFWLIKKELGMIHEFIADKKAVADNDTSTLAAIILQAAYPQHNFQLTNNFFHSPIKRRFNMLTKNNNRTNYFSRMLALPVLLFVFAAFTFKTVKQQPIYKGEKTIVVIDAGHGGKDLGAAGAGNIYEKDLALAIVKKIKAINTNNNIEIILSRETDIYQSPPEKAAFANNANAKLLVSIHIAATAEPATGNSGLDVYVSKDNFPNSSESKVLASAFIETFKTNYSLPVKEKPLQREKGIWLLQASNCPAVLIEPGVITNKKDLAFIQSEKGQETIAQNVLKGIEKYLTATAVESTLSPTKENEEIKTITGTADKRALLVIDGKKSGSLESMEKKLKELNIDITELELSASIHWLEAAEAIAKYGDNAKFGAIEISNVQVKAVAVL